MTLDELNTHYELRVKKAKAEALLDSLKTRATHITPILTGMPHATGVSDKVGDLTAEIADLDARIYYLECEIEKERVNIEGFIATIEDDLTRMIFRLRFIRCYQWGEVAYVIGGNNTEQAVKMMCYRYLDKQD